MAFLPADLEVPTLLETDHFRLRPTSGGSPTRAGSPSRTGQLLGPGQPGQGVHDQVDGVATAVPPASYAEADVPRRWSNAVMDQERRPESLPGVVLDAYWTSLAHDPLSTLLLTGLLSLGGVLVVLLGHIVADLVGQLVRLLS